MRPFLSSDRGLLRLAGIAVAILAVAGLALFFDLTALDTSTVVAEVRSSGAFGSAALIALLVVQAVIAPLPSPPLLMAAGLVYGPVIGFGIGWVGLLLGASACFGLARVFGRPFAERFVRPERLAALDRTIGTRSTTSFLTVVSLRALLPPAFDAVSYACGVVGIPFHRFALATALGEIPKVASFTYLGALAGNPPRWLSAWILLVPVAGLALLWLVRRRFPGTDPLAKDGAEPQP